MATSETELSNNPIVEEVTFLDNNPLYVHVRLKNH